MKTAFVTFVLFSTVYITCLNVKRQYFAEENDPYRFKQIVFQNDEDVVRIENLTNATEVLSLPSNTDVTLYLYTRKNLNAPISLKLNNLDDLKNTKHYRSEKEVFLIVHGWLCSYESHINTVLKNAILKTSDSNVFVLDWQKIAHKNYFTAFSSVQSIGKYVGDFINNLIEHYNISRPMFNLIGHSIGAHIVGCIGASVNGSVNYIVGLDPAGPLFSLGITENRLDKSDAAFVEVIHTSILLGFRSSIGHVDYFPNGSDRQPGCGPDLFRSCAHSRSYQYLEESILSGGFTSKKCGSYNLFKKGKCNSNPNSTLGSINIDKSANGDYFLDTRASSPYSLF